MKKIKILAISVCCAALVSLSGCVEVQSSFDTRDDMQVSSHVASAGQGADERQRMMAVYDEIPLDATFDTMVEKFGEGRKINVKISERYYLWMKGSAGAYVSFFEDGSMQSKTLYFKRYRDLASVTNPIDRAAAEALKRGQTYDEIKAILGGDGVETAISRLSKGGDAEYHRQVIWCNADESYVQCVFDAKDKLQTFHTMGFN